MVSAATPDAAKSWVVIPSDSDFSIDNIPFGVCSFPNNNEGTGCTSLASTTPRCCTAIGDYAVDLHLLAEAGLLDDLSIAGKDGTKVEEVNNFHPRVVFSQPSLNDFMACEKTVWVAVRNRLISLFLNESHGGLSPDARLQSNASLRKPAFHPLANTLYHLPAEIGDYTDFYSSREHATNVGIMFRGKDNALQPNWLHMPIGYHGRSSSIYPSLSAGAKGNKENVITMSTVRRPCGQLQTDPTDPQKGSVYGPCKLMDFELEVAFFVGGSTNRDSDGNRGRPLTMAEAEDRIFGYVLMNDWSARDIQKWEYVPLGPFTSKNFATTISTWVVTPMALRSFRSETSAGSQGGVNESRGTELSEGVDVGGSDGKGKNEDPTPLEYLRDPNYGSYDVSLSVSLQPDNSPKATQICQSNLKHMYWSSVQQLVHHSVTGCPMIAGDLLASGTISGRERHNFGSMLELSWKGTREIPLDDGSVRKFLQDGDAVVMKGWCTKEGSGRVGFGQCSARVLPAVPYPHDSHRIEERKPKERYTKFKLYGFWRSSCTWRVRIALSAKGIPHETISVNLFEKDQDKDEHRLRNPMGQVPVLEFLDGAKVVRLTQSLAIIEFLESAFANQGGHLLPLDPVARAKAKEVAEVISSGTQPLQNLSVMDSIKIIGGEERVGAAFAKRAIENGLSSVEALLVPCHSVSPSDAGANGGPFAIGTYGPSLADVCLIPQMYNARRFGVDCTVYPTLLKVEKACEDHPWFLGAAPEMQPDYSD